jgi:Zn-dependent peptidase ImmA (M78 family)
VAKGIPSFHQARLTQAREARGLTGVNLANIVGVSASTISQYEHGASKPTAEMLDKLAAALNVPKLFFLRALDQRAATRFFYRSMSAATKSARARAEARFSWLTEIVTYFESYFDFPSVSLPVLDVPPAFRQITDEMIDNYASHCRKHWGLREGPVPSMVRLLEKNGFVVSRCRLDAETLDAFSESDSTSRPFVILGMEKQSCVRSRFDAAHELAHSVMHCGVEQRSLLTAQDHALLEQQAHRFAAAFLLPEEDFAKDLVAPTLESFSALKERWKVSMAAMIMRCSQLGIVSEQQQERLWMNLGRRGWRKWEPWDDRLPVEQPKLLRQCMDMMLGKNFKTRAQIADELCLPVRDVEELAGLPEGYLSEGFGEIIPLQFKGAKDGEGDAGGIIPFKIG